MKATVDAKAFYSALDLVRRAPKCKILPCLMEISLRFESGRCTLFATDLETWLTAELPAQGDDFSLTLRQTKDVSKACRHFDGALTLEVTDSGDSQRKKRMTLSCGTRSGVFEVMPLDDAFPALPAIEEQVSFTTNAAVLMERINRVRYAAGQPSPNGEPVRTCVQFDGNRIFSLDGYRLACDIGETLTVPKPFLVPGSSLAYLKLLGEHDVSVRLSPRYVRFDTGTVALYCRIAGETPFKLDDSIPQYFQEEFYVSPTVFLQELDYMKTFLLRGSKPYVRFHGGELSFFGSDSQCRTAIELDGSSTIDFGFNLYYMADAMNQFKDAGWVKLKISGANLPIIIETEGRSDFALVLPLRLKESAAA